jgi:hypothetical protein
MVVDKHGKTALAWAQENRPQGDHQAADFGLTLSVAASLYLPESPPPEFPPPHICVKHDLIATRSQVYMSLNEFCGKINKIESYQSSDDMLCGLSAARDVKEFLLSQHFVSCVIASVSNGKPLRAKKTSLDFHNAAQYSRARVQLDRSDYLATSAIRTAKNRGPCGLTPPSKSVP